MDNAENNGTAAGSYAANIATKSVTGLSAGTTYYFNVIVQDEAGNKAAYTSNSRATEAAVINSYVVSGYTEDSGHGAGTYTKIADINGKVAYEFDNSSTYTNAVYTIFWSSTRSRWEIYNDSYYPSSFPGDNGDGLSYGDADSYDYYNPDTGDTPPSSGWEDYNGNPAPGLTLSAQ